MAQAEGSMLELNLFPGSTPFSPDGLHMRNKTLTHISEASSLQLLLSCWVSSAVQMDFAAAPPSSFLASDKTPTQLTWKLLYLNSQIKDTVAKPHLPTWNKWCHSSKYKSLNFCLLTAWFPIIFQDFPLIITELNLLFIFLNTIALSLSFLKISMQLPFFFFGQPCSLILSITSKQAFTSVLCLSTHTNERQTFCWKWN